MVNVCKWLVRRSRAVKVAPFGLLLDCLSLFLKIQLMFTAGMANAWHEKFSVEFSGEAMLPSAGE